MSQKIVPHLWFDKEAAEAAEFYTSVFDGDSRVKKSTTLHGTPGGDSQIVPFILLGQDFMAISAGPLFKFNPSISFLVACDSTEEVQRLWDKLSEGGATLMEIGEYPFSQKYGWLQDKYGLSWQIMYMDPKLIKQRITPTLMFVGDVCGKAEEAINFYVSVFKDAELGDMMRYEADEAPDRPGTIKHASFTLESQAFAAMDSARMHDFGFNEAISLMVYCQDQTEIDYYWEKLSAVPEAEQCGWLKDKYGVSWQITPSAMDNMMAQANPEQMERLTQAFLKMKKFDLAKLRQAYEG